MTFPEAVRAGRASKTPKMRQEDLAKLVGVSRQTIMSIEHGNSNPAWPLAKKIAETLGLSLDSLSLT